MDLRKHSFKALFAVALLVAGVAPLSGALAQESLAEVHLYSTDSAPTDGTIEVYINYNYAEGKPFQPAGSLMASFGISAGQRLDVMLTGFPTNVNARAWFIPVDGEPSLLPSQHYPGGEFGTGADPDDAPFVYETSFAGAVSAIGEVASVSAGSILKSPGALQSVELDDGLIEWGYRLPDDDDDDDIGAYIQLGWSRLNADGTVTYSVPAGGPVTADELAQLVEGPDVAWSGGVVVHTDLGDGLTEWGYWLPNDDGDDSTEDIGVYTLLGWSQLNADETVSCSVPEDGPFTASELCQLVNMMN